MEYALGHRRVKNSDGRPDKTFYGGHSRKSFSIMDDEYATAVAAASFAIHSLEESQLHEPRKINESLMTTKTRRDDATRRGPNFGEASTKRSTSHDSRAPNRHLPSRASNATFSVQAPADKSQQQKGSFSKHNNFKTRAGAWERAKIEKIRKRYERLKFQILAWENEKKMYAKLKMEKKQKELENRIDANRQHYRSKLAWIDKIAQGARAQADEKRQYVESNAREKAKKMRTTGRVSAPCFCFNCPRLI